MTEFRAGDIVECEAARDGQFTRGRFYRAAEAGAHFIDVAADDGGKPNGWGPECFRLAFRPPAGEVWEPWNGGSRPEAAQGDVRVSVAKRDGSVMHPVDKGGFAFWVREGARGRDIIAYRVIPAEAAEPRKIEIWPSSDTQNCRRIQVDGAQWCKVYGWSPEQAQERAEAIAAALADTKPDDYERGRQMGRREVEIEACMGAPIDPSRIKAGDEVTVRGVVKTTKLVTKGRVLFTVETDDGTSDQFRTYSSAIVTHTQKAKPLAARDRVRVGDEEGVWTIEASLPAATGQVHWCVRGDPIRYMTCHDSALTRIEDPS